MDVKIKRVKNSPYKFVIHDKKVIGIFDHGRFINKAGFEEKHKVLEEEVLGTKQ